MTHEEIEEYRLELADILADTTRDRGSSLKELALKVGASTIQRYGVDAASGQLELVSNIYNALQTASMIDTCRTSAQNFEIAIIAMKASVKNNRIAAIIAFLSMLGAWAAVLF